MRYETQHRRAARAARATAALLTALALSTCHDAPTVPRREQPRWDLSFVSDARDGDPSPRLTTIGGTDSTLRLALQLPAATPLTALAWELEIAGSGLTLVSVTAGDLLASDPSSVAELAASDDAGHWLGAVSLGSYDHQVTGPGTVAVAAFRRTTTQPFTVRLRFVPGTTLYGGEGVATTDTVVAGAVVYRLVQL